MQRTKLLPVKDLTIDLKNFRTVEQGNEVDATKAMISISPDYFWALMESLLDDGYLPTENIIVIDHGAGVIEVKEGNRRVAALKIALGLIDKSKFDLPQKLDARVSGLTDAWKEANALVPCAVFTPTEADIVDRIVANTHGKGQKAGRDHWETIARARHNKIKNGISEPALDLLEKYLESGTNLTIDQKNRWAGKYNLSVLDEAIKKIAPRLGFPSSPELVKNYPAIPYKSALDNVIHAIGMETLTFPAMRDSTDFALRFGIPSSIPAAGDDPAASPTSGGAGAGASTSPSADTSASDGSSGGTTPPGATGPASTPPSPPRPPAAATSDEKSVKNALKALKLFGPNRAKLVTIKNEMLKLKLKDNPIAFCFLLRSAFEISAKAYCEDYASDPHPPKSTKPDGTDKKLADVLTEVVKHLTQNNSDKGMVKLLHGANAELARPNGILSVTSMNQLVHNPSFTILVSDIPPLFHNIFPLLEQMNK